MPSAYSSPRCVATYQPSCWFPAASLYVPPPSPSPTGNENPAATGYGLRSQRSNDDAPSACAGASAPAAASVGPIASDARPVTAPVSPIRYWWARAATGFSPEVFGEVALAGIFAGPVDVRRVACVNS